MSKGTLLLISFVMLPIGIIINGYALSVLWSWFIVTKFGLPTLTIAEALGVSVVVRYFTRNIAKTEWGDASNEQEAVQMIAMPFLKAGIFLGFGWIILQFI